MRSTRFTWFLAATLALALGASGVAASVVAAEEQPSVNAVTGTVALDPLVSLGEYSLDQGIHRYRNVPLAGPELVADDARLSGPFRAVLNYDIHRSGAQPVPAWGTVSLGDGDWSGTFTGIRRGDFEPYAVHAFLVGSGSYEGLCAVLDIEADNDAWVIDGVIHPLPMGA